MKTNAKNNLNVVNSELQSGFLARRNDRYSQEGLKVKALHISRCRPKLETIQTNNSINNSQSKNGDYHSDFIEATKNSGEYKLEVANKNKKPESLAGKGAVAQFEIFGDKQIKQAPDV
jgi:hypothetical protein